MVSSGIRKDSRASVLWNTALAVALVVGAEDAGPPGFGVKQAGKSLSTLTLLMSASRDFRSDMPSNLKSTTSELRIMDQRSLQTRADMSMSPMRLVPLSSVSLKSEM